MENILFETLNSMPNTFSSNRFCLTAVKNGLDQYLVTNGTCLIFLHKNAIQSKSSRRLWSKKNNTNNNIQNCINILKNAGYRILRQKNDWEEL